MTLRRAQGQAELGGSLTRDSKLLKEFIREAAQQAGEILRAYFGTALTRQIKSHAEDFATEADLAAEQAIIARIKTEFPEDDIIAEESGKQGSNSTGYTWIIDPLDGTYNFANNVTDFGTMIAVAQGEVLQAAAVFNPYKKLFAIAAVDEGTELNGNRVVITQQHSAEELQQILATIKKTDRMAYMRQLRDQLNQHNWRPSRLRSAAAYALDVLEQQRDIDLSMLPGKVWDFAAPALLLAESGLVASNFQGQPYIWSRDSEGYITCTPELHQVLFPTA